MAIEQWIIAGISFITLLILIIGLFSRNASRISVLESEIITAKTEQKRLDEELKLHNSMNEKTFSRLETQLNEINKQLSTLIGFVEAKLK